MNEGVKILLERMKTNPEEFTTQEKWGHLIQSHKMFLNEEDAKALGDALNELMQQRFTEKVMTELLAPEEDGSLGKPWYSKQSAMPLGGATPARSSVTLNNTNAVGTWTTKTASGTLISWEDREPLVNKKPVVKKHKTLFGRLFNYQ